MENIYQNGNMVKKLLRRLKVENIEAEMITESQTGELICIRVGGLFRVFFVLKIKKIC